MRISKTSTTGKQNGHNYWIYQDRLGSKLKVEKEHENKIVWFLFFETNDKERKRWSGWMSQWDYVGNYQTKKEAMNKMLEN